MEQLFHLITRLHKLKFQKPHKILVLAYTLLLAWLRQQNFSWKDFVFISFADFYQFFFIICLFATWHNLSFNIFTNNCITTNIHIVTENHILFLKKYSRPNLKVLQYQTRTLVKSSKKQLTWKANFSTFFASSVALIFREIL